METKLEKKLDLLKIFVKSVTGDDMREPQDGGSYFAPDFHPGHIEIFKTYFESTGGIVSKGEWR